MCEGLNWVNRKTVKIVAVSSKKNINLKKCLGTKVKISRLNFDLRLASYISLQLYFLLFQTINFNIYSFLNNGNKFLRFLPPGWGRGGGGGEGREGGGSPLLGYIGMCGPKGYGFSAVLHGFFGHYDE